MRKGGKMHRLIWKVKVRGKKVKVKRRMKDKDARQKWKQKK